MISLPADPRLSQHSTEENKIERGEPSDLDKSKLGRSQRQEVSHARIFTPLTAAAPFNVFHSDFKSGKNLSDLEN